jgi:hypothetical protein
MVRREQQRGWAKALVRPGVDARMALAGVLGMSAEELRVRDRAE